MLTPPPGNEGNASAIEIHSSVAHGLPCVGLHAKHHICLLNQSPRQAVSVPSFQADAADPALGRYQIVLYHNNLSFRAYKP